VYSLVATMMLMSTSTRIAGSSLVKQ
jgi:hypothetical protein